MSGMKKPPPVPDDNSWMDTFADMMSLLLCFFILLAAVSKPDAAKYEQISSGMTQDFANQSAAKPIETMKQELTEVITAYNADQAVDVGTDDRGLVLNLDSGAVFDPGSANVKPELMTVLKEIAATLTQPRFANYRIEIQGHTDDEPSGSPLYPTNWDLSSARGLAILKAMSSLGIEEQRLLLAAYAQFSPRAPNRAPDGTPYPENQAINRRVALHVYPK